MSLLSKANNLAYYELLGDAAIINKEMTKYLSASKDAVQDYVQKVFREENSNTLFYEKKN